MKISLKQQKIILILIEKGTLPSSAIYKELTGKGEDISLITIKRQLSDLAEKGLIKVSGFGRATAYEIGMPGRIFAEIDAKKYCADEPDKRFGLKRYNFDLFSALPTDIFSSAEQKALDAATAEYARRTKDIPPAIQKKELERLTVELAWKSSKIEGNTYTLLDTEKLILENKEAPGHDRKETRMILNHKEAFAFIRDNAPEFRTLTRANLERLHAILVKDMGVGTGFRSRPVGVTGSVYRPLGNIYQLREGVQSLSEAVSRLAAPCAKALVALLGISYLQLFEDGNKRTARLMANALLLAHGCAPLSYRSVEENEYRDAILVFYEINSIVPFKKIFLEQYEFAAKNYSVK